MNDFWMLSSAHQDLKGSLANYFSLFEMILLGILKLHTKFPHTNLSIFSYDGDQGLGLDLTREIVYGNH